MALYHLQGLSPAEEFEQQLGSNFASSLGSGLNALAQNKMKQMQGNAFGKLVNPEIAKIIPYLDPKIQQILLERGVVEQEGKSNDSNTSLEEILNQLNKGMSSKGQVPDESQESSPVSSMQAFNMMYGKPEENIVENMQQRQYQKPESNQGMKSESVDDIVQDVKNYDRELKTLKNQEPKLKLGKSSQEKYQDEVLQLKKDEILNKKQEKSLELKKEQYDTISSADKNIRDYHKILELDVENKIDNPGFLAFLENSGLGNLDALTSPGTQAFKNISKNFLNNLKDIFGSRLNETEVQLYMDALPGLLNSPEGRKEMIKNAILIEEGKKAKAQNVFEILKENKGQVPSDFYEQRMERDNKKLDQIAKQIERQFKNIKVPETNKLKTFALASAGKAIGAAPSIGKALAKAGAGAYTGANIGKQFGPQGALVGGGIGGLGGLFS